MPTANGWTCSTVGLFDAGHRIRLDRFGSFSCADVDSAVANVGVARAFSPLKPGSAELVSFMNTPKRPDTVRDFKVIEGTKSLRHPAGNLFDGTSRG